MPGSGASSSSFCCTCAAGGLAGTFEDEFCAGWDVSEVAEDAPQLRRYSNQKSCTKLALKDSEISIGSSNDRSNIQHGKNATGGERGSGTPCL